MQEATGTGAVTTSTVNSSTTTSVGNTSTNSSSLVSVSVYGSGVAYEWALFQDLVVNNLTAVQAPRLTQSSQGIRFYDRAFCACRLSCGAFVNHTDMYAAMLDMGWLGWISGWLITNTWLLWFAIGSLFLLLMFKRNEIIAHHAEHSEQDLSFQAVVDGLKRRLRTATKQIELRRAADDMTGTGGGGSGGGA